MCWATPRNLLWIFVDELAIEGELNCDLLNLSEGFKKWFTWEDLPLFTGHGGVQRDGLTTQACNSVRDGYINPEYNGGDVGHGEVDDHVVRAIKLAAASEKIGTAGGRRFVLVIPLFSRGNDEYRNAVAQTGGRILLECPPGSMRFIQTITGKAAAKRERVTYNTSSQQSCSRTWRRRKRNRTTKPGSSDDSKRGSCHKGKQDSQLGALWNSSRMISDGGPEQPESIEMTRVPKGDMEALAGYVRNGTRSWEGSGICHRHSER